LRIDAEGMDRFLKVKKRFATEQTKKFVRKAET
jgi:hypothetical protein